MRTRQLSIDDVLRAVEQHAVAVDMVIVTGFGIEAVHRRLRRAELAELVVSTRCGSVNVWELTDKGRERLRRAQPILGTRTSVPAGTVVE